MPSKGFRRACNFVSRFQQGTSGTTLGKVDRCSFDARVSMGSVEYAITRGMFNCCKILDLQAY